MYTLGINLGHGSSVCLINDEKILFASAEERLSRIKFDTAFPSKAIDAALTYSGLELGDLGAIAIGWPSAKVAFLHDLSTVALNRVRPSCANTLDIVDRFFKEAFSQNASRVIHSRYPSHHRTKILLFGHHLSHAMSAAALSGLPKTTVLVIDGRGARHATSIWFVENGRYRLLESILYPNSLGLLYYRFTGYLGFVPLADEWKVMGLAAYGGPGVCMDPFVRVKGAGYDVNAHAILGRDPTDLSFIERYLGPARCPHDPIQDRHRDIAYALQAVTEEAMVRLAQHAVSLSGCQNLCIVGGVAMNCKANGEVWRRGIAETLFVPPAASDEGTSVGAAVAAHMALTGNVHLSPMRHAYYGQQSSDSEVEASLNKYKLEYRLVENPALTAAEQVARGRVVGWFQGRTEFGERALGARSILGDPRDVATRDRINSAIKYREQWRPFAPAIKVEAAPQYFENCYDSPFMTVTYRARPCAQELTPAIVHADGTARVQTVSCKDSPLFWQLLDHFEVLTGVPLVLNTSFNLRGDPIVNGVKDAIATFYTSGMDALVIGNYLVLKPGKCYNSDLKAT